MGTRKNYKGCIQGGDEILYKKIAQAASKWISEGKANLSLSFTNTSGKYRAWSIGDTTYSGEIRIAFESGEMGGYWSHVGTDSINQDLIGGASGQASMNLDSFDRALPYDWEAIVMHEFGHALGFQHEHQNPIGGCDFRFADDIGYIKSTDQDGWYTTDANGRRPGLYTYLGGKANYWPREKVDQNLQALKTSSAYLVGNFDKNSIMKYFFNAFMFKAGEKSSCYTATENLALSAQDVLGIQTAYPRGATEIAAMRSQQRTIVEQLKSSPTIDTKFSQRLSTQLQKMQ